MNFSNCFHPIITKNIYTDERLVVSCRKCPACRERHQLEWVTRLRYECSLSPYVLFFTLTYDEDCVPFIRTYKAYGTVWLSSAVYRGCDDSVIGSISSDDVDFGDFAYNNGFTEDDVEFVARRSKIRIVFHQDIITFIKNLKQKFNYNYGEKLRYFICEEYGSKRFRPHYHGLLFAKNKESAKFMYQSLVSCWPFGIVDASFAKNGAFGYVAKYVSGSFDYPKIYDYKEFRCKSFASKRPPLGMPEFSSKEFREILFDETRKIELISNRRFESVSFWRSLENGCFPRCEKFSELSFDDRIGLYIKALPYFKKSIEFGLSGLNVKAILKLFFLGDEESVSKELRSYAVSYHFLKVCYLLGLDVYQYAHIIDDYYSSRSLFYLKEFYMFQESICKIPYLRKYLINLYPLSFADMCTKEYGFLPNYKRNLCIYFGLDYDSYLDSHGLFDVNLFNSTLKYDFSPMYKKWTSEVSNRVFDNSKTKLLNSYYFNL